MKLKYLFLLVALSGVAAAGPDQPGFTTPPSWVDANNDGTIDELERQAFIDARKDAARGLYAEWDTDGDGLVDDDERQEAIDALRARANERICELFEDLAGEDGLTIDELASLPGAAQIPPQTLALLFSFLDTDGDGVVTKEEFLGALGGGIGLPPAP